LWPALDTSGPLVLTFDARDLAYGQYQATVSIYDAAMSEAAITRAITLVPPEGPLLFVEPDHLDSQIFVSETPAPQAFTIRNIGMGTLCYTIGVSVPGPSVSDTDGCVDAGTPGDTITGTYDDFGPGLPPALDGHDAVIIVDAGPAENSPRNVDVKVVVTTLPVDFDLDGDVDSNDYGTFQACLSGPGQIPNPQCGLLDFDHNTAVDSGDRLAFQNCMSGANIPPDKNCMDGISLPQ
jgi:hypothetical protein